MIETRRSLWGRRIIGGSDVRGLDHAVVVSGNGGGGKGCGNVAVDRWLLRQAPRMKLVKNAGSFVSNCLAF